MACLGYIHLQQVATCGACKALCSKDRPARRFTCWKKTGKLLSARAMRNLMQAQPTPRCLKRKVLEPFYTVQEVDTVDSGAEEDPSPITHRLPTSTLITPAEGQTSSREPAVRCSLLLGGPRQQHPPSTGASALDPVTLSSPEAEVFTLDENYRGGGGRGGIPTCLPV